MKSTNNTRYNLSNGCPILDYEISVDTDGMLYPCCNTTSYKFENLIDLRAWQLEQKSMFLKNTWPTACNVCKIREKNTNSSIRIESQIDNDYDIKSAVPQIKDIQVAYKNLCNLSCIMCDINGSSTIYEYSVENTQVPVNWEQRSDKKHITWNKKNLDLILEVAPTLHKITFIGGEPFLIKEYLLILKKLSPSCKVLVVTNGTIYNKNFINELKKFKKLAVMFSIDGYGIVNEALRLKSNWNTIEKNILKIKEDLPIAITGISPAWSSFNIFYWKSLQDWAIKHQLYDPTGFWQNVITYPDHLKLCYISDNWKEYILKNCNNKKLLSILALWFNEPQTEDLDIVKNQWKILKTIGKNHGFDYEDLFPHIYQDFNNFQQR